MDNITALMEFLVASRNQPPLAQPQQTMVTSEAPTVPVFVTLITVAQNRMPQGYPWGIPENFMLESYNQYAQQVVRNGPSKVWGRLLTLG